MRNINLYILEKLRINKNTKVEDIYYVAIVKYYKDKYPMWIAFSDFDTLSDFMKYKENVYIDGYKIPKENFENDIHYKIKYNDIDTFTKYCDKNNFKKIVLFNE